MINIKRLQLALEIAASRKGVIIDAAMAVKLDAEIARAEKTRAIQVESLSTKLDKFLTIKNRPIDVYGLKAAMLIAIAKDPKLSSWITQMGPTKVVTPPFKLDFNFWENLQNSGVLYSKWGPVTMETNMDMKSSDLEDYITDGFINKRSTLFPRKSPGYLIWSNKVDLWMDESLRKIEATRSKQWYTIQTKLEKPFDKLYKPLDAEAIKTDLIKVVTNAATKPRGGHLIQQDGNGNKVIVQDRASLVDFLKNLDKIDRTGKVKTSVDWNNFMGLGIWKHPISEVLLDYAKV